MKILIATDTYYPHVNGASYFAQRLAFYLQMHENTIAVIAPSITHHNTKGSINGILVYGIWSLPVFFYKKFRFCLPPLFLNGRIKDIIQEFDPDIIHIQGHFFISRTVLRRAKARGICVIATNHFMPENLVHYLHVPLFLTNMISKWSWGDLARVFNLADYVTTPTHAAAALLPRTLITPVIVISNGIDRKLFNPHNDGSYLISRYHIPNKPAILYVGRLDQEKNLDVVIRACALVAKSMPLQLIIAGSGVQQEKLQDLTKTLSISNFVTFTGFVPDVDLPNLYPVAVCFVNAGTAELQSIVTMEAMATGLPILAANAHALPELVQDGKNGFLFPARDYETLAKRIEQLLQDESLKKRMGEESLDSIVQHDINKVITSFEDLYQRVLSNVL